MKHMTDGLPVIGKNSQGLLDDWMRDASPGSDS